MCLSYQIHDMDLLSHKNRLCRFHLLNRLSSKSRFYSITVTHHSIDLRFGIFVKGFMNNIMNIDDIASQFRPILKT